MIERATVEDLGRNRSRWWWVVQAAGVATCLVAMATCSDDDQQPGPTTGAGASGAGGAAGGTGPGGGGSLPLDGGPDGSADYGCSADLRSVIDANGAVVQECPADQGCLDGECIEACAAAAGSHGNVGCDFRVTTPPAYSTTLPPCLAVFVANTWPRPAQLTVDRDGQSYDVTQFGRIPENGQPESAWPAVPATGIPEGEVAVLFLSHDPNSVFPENGVPQSCPLTPAIDASTLLDATGTGEAFHIVSDTPVSAYDILPYGGARSHFPSAQLLFPTNAWGSNYVVIATMAGTHTTPGPLWGQVLATEDGTTVQVLPSVDLPAGGGLPAAPQGQTASFNLSAGQYLQWELPDGAVDMSGTVIQSDRPVAVFAGNRFLRLQPTPGPGGESTHQQMLAVSALSHEYVGAPYETRRADLAPEEVDYRIVGAFDDTTLIFDPPIPGAPGIIGQSDVVDFATDQPFYVRSQDADHPFAMAQVMDTSNLPGGTRPGATAPGYALSLGDEEFVVVLPPAQFLKRYVFFTDPAYPTTNLVITRVADVDGFHAVEVDCLGAIGGWQPIGVNGRYEFTTVDLIRAEVGVGSCDNGRHTAHSDGAFGVVVWGLDSYSSYAYPAGGNAAQLTDAEVPVIPN